MDTVYVAGVVGREAEGRLNLSLIGSYQSIIWTNQQGSQESRSD